MQYSMVQKYLQVQAIFYLSMRTVGYIWSVVAGLARPT
jgi:hypothetical protein